MASYDGATRLAENTQEDSCTTAQYLTTFLGGTDVSDAGAVSLGAPVVIVVTNLNNVGRATPVVFTVVGQGANLARAWVSIAYSGLPTEEMLHDGDRFGSSFSGGANQRNAITNGYQFTILRDGGWPGIPALNIKAVDAFGGTT